MGKTTFDFSGQVVVITVTLSLVLHSLTARPGIRLCAARQRDDAVTGDVRSHQSTINDA